MKIMPLPIQVPGFLSVCALVVFSASAQAQELAQVRFEGSVGPGKPGMLVVRVEGMVKQEARKVELELFLAPKTRGGAVAGLIAARLSKAGFDVIHPGGTGSASGGTFMIEDALRLEILAPAGLNTSLGSPSSAPAYFGVVAKLEQKDAFEIQLSTVFRLPVERGTEQIDFLATVEGPVHPTQMVESISTQALKHGLRSERPKSIYWRPLATVKSNTCLGFCSTWNGRPGWGAVLGLVDHR